MRYNITRTVPKELVYTEWLELMQPHIRELKPLRNKDLQLLGQLIYAYNKHTNVEEEYRWATVLSQRSKGEMRDRLNMSKAVFDNNMSRLRKSGLLVDNKVIPALLKPITEETSVDFRINFDIL